MSDLARMAVVALAGLAVGFRVFEPWPVAGPMGILATLLGGYPVFAEAARNLRQRRMTMELSMTIALVAADGDRSGGPGPGGGD